MASHRPHCPPPYHHPCQNPLPTASITTTTCYCSCHYNHCCTQSHYSPTPPPQHLSIDPLVQAFASFLQQQQQLPNTCSPCTNKPHTQSNHHQNLQFWPQNLHFQQLGDGQKVQSVLSSLLQRIHTLESSLHHFSTSSASGNRFHPSYSLREAAARIIQTHFRAFLVRRSRTLSQLQDLAFIKSSFNSLKSSISNKTHFKFEVLSHKAMDLLLKLDSIKGGDPMIRDGKRSISRDILRFLEFIDGLVSKRHGSSHKPAKNGRFVRNSNTSRTLNASIGYGDRNGNQKEIVQKLNDKVDRIRGISRVCDNDEEDVELEGFQQFIDDEEEGENPKVSVKGRPGISKTINGILIKSNGVKPRVKKTVSFAENGNVYRVFSDSHESVLSGDGSFADGSDSSDDHGETIDCIEIEERKGICKGTENDEIAVSSQSSEGERNPERNLQSGDDYEINLYCQDQDGNLVFSAPVPVKMESRADLMKRKAGKTVT